MGQHDGCDGLLVIVSDMRHFRTSLTVLASCDGLLMVPWRCR